MGIDLKRKAGWGELRALESDGTPDETLLMREDEVLVLSLSKYMNAWMKEGQASMEASQE